MRNFIYFLTGLTDILCNWDDKNKRYGVKEEENKRCVILFLFWQVQKEKKQTVFVRNGFVSSHCQAISGSVNLLALVRSVCACLHTTTATNVLTPLATNTVALKLYMVNSSYSENPRENAHTHTKNKSENHGQGNRSNTVLLYFTNWTCPGLATSSRCSAFQKSHSRSLATRSQ